MCSSDLQKLIPTPRRLTQKYPVEAGTDPTHMVLLNWLMHEEPMSDQDEIALSVLDHLLMGTPTSALYKPMIESGLGSAIMGGGVSDELKQATFSIGLKGVKPEDVPAVEQLAISTLAQVASEGFEADAVEASLNTVEFRLREFNTGGFPKGLSLMLGMMPNWLYDKGPTPTDALRFEQPLAKLKARLESGEAVFEELLQRFIVDNKHLATVELAPDATLAEQQKAAEVAVLAKAKEGMSEADVQRIIADTKALKEAQLREIGRASCRERV